MVDGFLSPTLFSSLSLYLSISRKQFTRWHLVHLLSVSKEMTDRVTERERRKIFNRRNFLCIDISVRKIRKKERKKERNKQTNKQTNSKRTNKQTEINKLLKKRKNWAWKKERKKERKKEEIHVTKTFFLLFLSMTSTQIYFLIF